jgi:hypothetical protein
MFAQLDKMLQTSHEIIKQSKEMLQQANIDVKQVDTTHKEIKDELSELDDLDKKITPFKTQLKADIKKVAISTLNVSWDIIREAQKGTFNYSITEAYEAFMPGIQLILEPLKSAIVKTLTKSWNLLTKLAISSLTYLGKLLLKPFARFGIEKLKEKKKLTKENAQIYAIYQTITGLGSTLNLVTELTGVQFEGIKSLVNLISNPQAAAIIATAYHKFIESREKKSQVVTATSESTASIVDEMITEADSQVASVMTTERAYVTRRTGTERQQENMRKVKSLWKDALNAIGRTQRIFSRTIKRARTRTVKFVKGVFSATVSPFTKVKNWALSGLASVKRLSSIISSKIGSFKLKLKEVSIGREIISKEKIKDEKEEECLMLKQMYESAKRKLASLVLAALSKVSSIAKPTTTIKNFFTNFARRFIRTFIRPFRVTFRRFRRMFRKFFKRLVFLGKTITKEILVSVKFSFRWAFELAKKVAGRVLGRIFETSASQVSKQVLKRLLAPVIKVITRFLTRAASVALSSSVVGTGLGAALFALDMKYDFSGKLVDWLIDQAINLPSTISRMLDNLKKVVNSFKENLNDIGDSILDPIINVLELIRMLIGTVLGGVYSVTIGPIASKLSKIASFLGLDTVAKRISMINEAIKENLNYQPNNLHKTLLEKLLYIPELIVSPLKAIVNIIKSAFQTNISPETQQSGGLSTSSSALGTEFGRNAQSETLLSPTTLQKTVEKKAEIAKPINMQSSSIANEITNIASIPELNLEQEQRPVKSKELTLAHLKTPEKEKIIGRTGGELPITQQVSSQKVDIDLSKREVFVVYDLSFGQTF